MSLDYFKEEPYIEVGIMSGQEIRFQLIGEFTNYRNQLTFEGDGIALFENGMVKISSGYHKTMANTEQTFIPCDIANCRFVLHDVTIGIDFHWQRKDSQQFEGELLLKVDDGKIWAINRIPLEFYLKSVISSEMNPLSPFEFLKVHAIISRSWLLAQIMCKLKPTKKPDSILFPKPADNEIIRWYDREDHDLFDVCADDHCQRYQGIPQEYNKNINQAINETRGMVVAYRNEVCDTRFSKCCGGASESFENAWQSIHFPYLTKVVDNSASTQILDADLTIEKNVTKFITSSPIAFCNTQDNELLSNVLKSYDQETTNFYRWEVEYQQDELSSLISEKSGIDFGNILDLVPLQRGVSGRIVKLKIVGSLKNFVVGKELEIRKWLSYSHLYSSAFLVEKINYKNDVPGKFILKGAGWGHGVGLCQIGAAVMGSKGYSCKAILAHYFKGAEISKIY